MRIALFPGSSCGQTPQTRMYALDAVVLLAVREQHHTWEILHHAVVRWLDGMKLCFQVRGQRRKIAMRRRVSVPRSSIRVPSTSCHVSANETKLSRRLRERGWPSL